MSRRHYIAMAESLRLAHPSRHLDARPFRQTLEQWERDVQAVADVFAQDNGSFSRERFYTAAGLER